VLALHAIQQLAKLDVVIIGRGGGASEDLSAFNDEAVARAVADCRVPIVSAVGHEVDISIVDLVADMRAATPSHAAELVVPERDALSNTFGHAQRELERAMEMQLGQHRLRLERCGQRLEDPRRALHRLRSSMEALSSRVERAAGQQLRARRKTLQQLHQRLLSRDVRRALARDHSELMELRSRLLASRQPLLARRKALLGEAAARLQALSPLGVLARGYAIALHEDTGKALLDASQVAAGDRVVVRLHQGRLKARVEDTER